MSNTKETVKAKKSKSAPQPKASGVSRDDDDDGSCSIQWEEDLPFQVASSSFVAMINFLRQALGVNGFEVSIQLVSNRTIQELNTFHRQKNVATDVLSFPALPWKKPPTLNHPHTSKGFMPPLLGDIVISLETASAQAQELNQPLDREVAFLLVHGFLHLLGHDHLEPQQEETMLNEQRAIIEQWTHTPTPLWSGCVIDLSSTEKHRII